MAAKKFSTKQWKNPFYALLIPAGLAFCITGCAYGLMAFGEVNASSQATTDASSATPIPVGHPLNDWLQAHGTDAILIELGILAVLTIGVIATDDWWMKEEEDKKKEEK